MQFYGEKKMNLYSDDKKPALTFFLKKEKKAMNVAVS